MSHQIFVNPPILVRPGALRQKGLIMPAAQHSFTPLTVSPGGALILAGIVPADRSIRMADKCAWAQICRGTFPFPLITLDAGRRRHLVRIVDIELTLARLVQHAADATPHKQTPAPVKRGRGRPRKIARGAEAIR